MVVSNDRTARTPVTPRRLSRRSLTSRVGYCARVLNPGSTTWPQAFPAFLVAVALLFVPGTVAGLLARVRPLAALAVAPVLSTSCLAMTGIAAPLVGLRWGFVPLACGILLMWLMAALVGLAETRLASRWPWYRRRVDGDSAVDDDSTAGEAAASSPDVTPGQWARVAARLDSTTWATVAGVAFAFLVVAYTLIKVSNTPEAFPQHPDTIFHLADAQWMLERGDISSLTANGYITLTGTGFYPAAFHGFTATIAQFAGVPVAVSTSVFVLAVAGLVWPIGCIALAQSVLGRRTPVVLATAATCVAFTGYPYFLMGFGVLWPNLFGETLLPAYLVAFVALFGRRAVPAYTLAPPLTAAAIVLLGLPGLGLAHPNAVMSFGVFAIIFLAGLVLGRAWAERKRHRPRRALALAAGTVVALGLVYAAATVVRPAAMLNTGAIGPELPVRAALADLVLLAPRGASYLPVLTVVTGIGVLALLVRFRGARWIVAAMVVMFGLYWVNVAIDTRWLRNLTWPWYNNAVRLQAVAILPTAIAAAAGLVAVVDLLAGRLRRLAGATLIATAGVLSVFVVGTHEYVAAHGEILNRYFHPRSANSWASNGELRALHTLAQRIPDTAAVAANPWNGGTYLYVVSGRDLLIPTEKANLPGDRELLALKLDQVQTDPEVCAAAKREHVEWAITGGRPFAWVGDRMREYVGIDAVGGSSGWTKVETSGPYTLYRLTRCAG